MSGQSIDYEQHARDALRQVVKNVIKDVIANGLPGDHHFYISFHTTAPDVKISNRISIQYPKEMTIVLQHQFWDLKAEENHFEVRLSFSNIPELLVIPYSAIKVFFDPSVPYGLQFDQTARPEAVEDKSFLDESWNLGAENSDHTIEEFNDISNSFNDKDGTSPILMPNEEEASTDGINLAGNTEPLPKSANADDPDFDITENTHIDNDAADSKTGTDDVAKPEGDSAEIVSLDAFRKK